MISEHSKSSSLRNGYLGRIVERDLSSDYGTLNESFPRRGQKLTCLMLFPTVISRTSIPPMGTGSGISDSCCGYQAPFVGDHAEGGGFRLIEYFLAGDGGLLPLGEIGDDGVAVGELGEMGLFSVGRAGMGGAEELFGGIMEPRELPIAPNSFSMVRRSTPGSNLRRRVCR